MQLSARTHFHYKPRTVLNTARNVQIVEISTTAKQQNLLEAFFWLRMRSIGPKCMRPMPETKLLKNFTMKQKLFQKKLKSLNDDISEIEDRKEIKIKKFVDDMLDLQQVIEIPNKERKS